LNFPLLRNARCFCLSAVLVAIVLTLSAVVSTSAMAQSKAAPASATQASSTAKDPQIQTLIDAIKNDKTRQELIDALEKTNATPAQAAGQKVHAAAETQGVSSFGRQIAEFTQSIAQSAAGSAKAFADQLAAAPQRLTALGPGEIHVLLLAVRDVALSIVTTYAIFLILRYFSIMLFRRIGGRAHDVGVFRKIFLIVVSALIDAGVVVLAWAAGYLITLTVFGQFGQIGIRQSLYLNAFLIVELFRVVLRIVLSPATGELRLINISDPAARLLNNRLSWIINILGYGQLFIAPIFNQSVSFATGQAVSILLSLIALAIAVVMTVRHRHEVKNWLVGETTDQREPSRLAQFLAGYWYILVLAYFAFLFVVVLTQPAANLLPILAATAEVIVAFIIGIGITGWITKANRRGVRVPENVSRKLPLLEARLNAFIPRILTAVRVIVFLAILVFALDVIGAIHVGVWVNTQFGAQATAAVVSVVIILLVALAVWLAMTSWVDFRLNPDYGSVPSTRERTLLTLLRNAATIALLVITLMFVLSEVGVNIAPLIASAGVLGLAVGFGAQSLVKDIITGIFIQLENAINVGDVVTAGGVTGTAERLTIRSLSIRDLDGTFHIIPFSSVDTVANFMKGFSYSVCNMGVGYRENIEEVKDAMFAAFEMLRGDEANSAKIIGDMEWFGVTTFADSAVIVRTRIKTLAGSQWGIGRAYNGCLKIVFDERNIEIPFPQQTVYFGENKKGEAPVAHVRIARDHQKPRYSEKTELRNTAGVIVPSAGDNIVPDESDVADEDDEQGIVR